METKKYTKEELTERAKGVFRSNKSLAAVYASENGTFLNTKQYEAARKEGKHTGLIEIKNPAAKVMLIVDEPEKDAVITELKKEIAGKDARIAELTEEIADYESREAAQDAKIDRLNEGLGDAHVIISERDAEIAELKKPAATPSVPMTASASRAPKAPRKSSTKSAKG